MKQGIVTYGQTLMDFVLQEYGCYEAVTEFLALNYPLKLTDDLTPGQKLNVHDVVAKYTETNQAIASHYKQNGIRINSGWVAETETYVEPGYVESGYVN